MHGLSFQEANAHAQSLLGPQDAFIHPFDDPLLWEGHASMIDEVARAGLRPDCVVLSVGGGGLLSGVVAGLRRQGWDDVPVFAVETVGADSYAQSLAAGERVELPAIASIATSLGARKVSEHAFDLARAHPIRPVVVHGPRGGGGLRALHGRSSGGGGTGLRGGAGAGVRAEARMPRWLILRTCW